jgi:DNA repair exonuclease SbcCD ATPase subunit
VPSEAEIAAAAKALEGKGNQAHFCREDAEAALTAAEKVRSMVEQANAGNAEKAKAAAERIREARTHSVDEAMVTAGLLDQSDLPCPECDGALPPEAWPKRLAHAEAALTAAKKAWEDATHDFGFGGECTRCDLKRGEGRCLMPDAKGADDE